MGDYDDEKPSWRERDRQKDKSRFYGRSEKGEKAEIKEGPKNRWQAGRVKDALDRLFMGEKGTPEHDKFFAKLHAAYGSPRFLSAAEKYIEKYGFPDDFSTLLLLLDTKDVAIIGTTLEKLKEVFSSLTARQKEDVKRKVSIVAMADKSREIRTKAREVMEEMAREPVPGPVT